MSSLLGFQFVSKTTPFSVYKFLQSLLIFVMTCIESVLDSQTSYVSYFAVCYAVSVISWIVLLKFFVFYSPE